MRKRIAITQKKLNKKDYSLSYYIQDNGRPGKNILFLNGMFHGHKNWRNQSKGGYLKDNYNFVFIDYPGAGDSTKGAEGSFQTLLEDIRDVLDAESIKTVDLAGYSMGGMVAIAFAAGFPEYINNLVLINTAATLGDSVITLFRTVQTRLRSDMPLDKIFADVYPTFFSEPYLEKFTGIEEVVLMEYVSYNRNRLGLAQLIDELRQKPDIAELAPLLDMPVMMIISEEDRIFPAASQKKLGKLIPRCRINRISGGSHSVCVEEYRQVNRFFEDFLD